MCRKTSYVIQSRDALSAKVKSCVAQCDLWKADHDEAMKVLDLEEVIGELLTTFKLINRVDKLYGEFVRSCPEKYDYELDESLKASYRLYLSKAIELFESASAEVSEGWNLSRFDELKSIIDRMEKSAARDFDGESFDMADQLCPSAEVLRTLSQKD